MQRFISDSLVYLVASSASLESVTIPVPIVGPEKSHDLREVIKQDCGRTGRHPRPPSFGPVPGSSLGRIQGLPSG